MDKSKVFAEITFVLEQVPYSYNKLIPQDIKNKFKDDMDINHYNSFNKDKVFYKQKLDEETIKMLFVLFKKYWDDEDAYNKFDSLIEE